MIGHKHVENCNLANLGEEDATLNFKVAHETFLISLLNMDSVTANAPPCC